MERSVIEDFLIARKIDARLFANISTNDFSRYSFQLGPQGTIKSFENSLREFGLLVHSVNIPVLMTDFQNGLLHIDIVNKELQTVSYDALLSLSRNEVSDYKLPLLLGKDYFGKSSTVDLIDLPHLLVGGTTGSGKSMFLHNIIQTLSNLRTSQEVRLILIDPKAVEFNLYASQKNLAHSVISDLSVALDVLQKAQSLMEDRFKTLSKHGYRNIAECSPKHKMPYIVIIVDEVQSLLSYSKLAEPLLCSVAQKGRAAGMHLILATQHPSRDVINANIKANFPARVGFKTANALYSRVLLDQSGAESLMGKGDGLFKLDGHMSRFKSPLMDTTIKKKSFWDLLK